MCAIDGADSEGTPLGTEARRAKKAHKCEDCFRVIAPGETYHVSKWAIGGRVEQMKMCEHCHVAADWLSTNCDGFLWGGVWDDIYEHIEEYRGVYPAVVRDLKRLHTQYVHHWKFKRGPRAGSMLPIPKIPCFPSQNAPKDDRG
jgi:hypothetical protein